jgi:hypothetical protein
MDDVNYLAALVAALAAVVASTMYYIVFAKQLAELSPAYADAADTSPPPWKVLVELVRSLIVALVLARFAKRMDVSDLSGALDLGLVAWVGFPVVLLTGAVMWERVPPKLAAIHVGDWLIKLVGIALVVSLWD